ncbi:autotransporter domain-containing protein [uncultured Algimonas sp.]|uniref:autotransporter domain-containing protein n=1 Tax=uncultured Algimonas sp. TaxID=1547920 RepID=UPI002624D666|nr:autotransporter domain-containing protein [uncultured Algimonas sp.]
MPTKKSHSKFLANGAATFVLASLIHAPLANAVVPNDNTNSEEIVDTEGGVNGVGMFFSGGSCTGTLINPRTVLFAAHCVNDRPENAYGSTRAAAFAFDVDALPGLLNWIQNGFASNPDLFVYNINRISYDPRSLDNPAARGFLEADIALATLDTPAANVPAWAMLFSALPVPDALTIESGTGYHVNITGYGRTGSGTTGSSTPVDFRRRAAENYIGALTSLNQRSEFLFGNGDRGLPQNLYITDFDDPNQNSGTDFNVHLDNALPNEGTTASGDSGGPLILDAANNAITDMDIVIGVLSGGSTFLNGQPGSSYGSTTLYQPLYAFYEYIAANNPYKYVGARAGDGNWEDQSHWVTNLDPNYYIIDENGAVVNGFPDVPEQGVNATDGDFGATCVQFDRSQPGNCRDMSTGEDFTTDNPPGPSDAQAATGVVEGAGTSSGLVEGLEASLPGDITLDDVINIASDGIVSEYRYQQRAVNLEVDSASVAQAAPSADLPAPTIDNGLAGATDFVPDNRNPDAAAGVNGRYFDVTLSADGTTTLNSTVTIDRLTVSGANAGLTIAPDGSLTSLMDVKQTAGLVSVGGTLSSVGDYLLMSGMLTGSGTVQTPFLTNVMGAIAPGTMGGIGTLTIDGSAVLASASTLIIDIGADGVNDRLFVTGDSSLGGRVVFAPNADVRAGNSYTFLTTGGTQAGTFETDQVSAILRSVLSYGENSVMARIEAGDYLDVIASNSSVQSGYAQLLDASRGADALDPLFAALDLATAETIQSTLQSWAPVSETTNRSLAKASLDFQANFHRGRMSRFNGGNWGGKVTVMGSPIMLASNADALSAVSGETLMAAANGGSIRQTANIPDDYEVFLSGAFIDGDAETLSTGQAANPEDDFDGWSVAAGIERKMSDLVSVGASLNYTTLDADSPVGNVADSDYFAGAVYGQLRSSVGMVLDGLVSLGSYGTETSRIVTAPGLGTNTLTSDDSSLAFTADLLVSRPIEMEAVIVSPRFGLRNTIIDFDDIREEGGALALDIDRDKFHSTQARLGLAVGSKPTLQYSFQLTGDFVAELEDRDDDFTAGFAATNGSVNALFPIVATDQDWFELGASVGFDLGQTRISLSADTTVDRSDIDAQSYRASVSYTF